MHEDPKEQEDMQDESAADEQGEAQEEAAAGEPADVSDEANADEAAGSVDAEAEAAAFDADAGDADGSADDAEEISEEAQVEIPELKQILEGAILAADKPLSIDNMISLFAETEQPSRKQVRAVLEEIAKDFDDRGFELKEVASGYRFQVRERYADWISRLWEERPPRYSRALLETLALIAYKQPITRGDVEDIRGVAVSTNIIRTLLEREWIRVVGHRDVPGRPAIYATTRTFLDYFNLANLDELPTLSDIRDLDQANEELALDDEIIEPRTLDIESGEGAEDVEAAQDEQEDADLEAVSNQVNTIQENIRALFAAPEETDELDDDLDEAEVSEEAQGDPVDESPDVSAETPADDETPRPVDSGDDDPDDADTGDRS